MAKKRYGLSTYIGETLIGMPYPVFFDPHYCILINKPPVTLITGSPGSGKTFFGLVLASHSSICNKLGFILDPKGDFIALKKMERLGYINKVNIWSVINPDGTIAQENEGMLDPTCFTPNVSTNVTLTVDIIKMLVGDLSYKQNTELIPIIRDVVSRDRNPSFARVVQILITSQNDEIRSLGYSLQTLLDTPLAKLLVTNKNITRKTLEINEGTVVANLMGLKLPADSTKKEDYKAEEKISVCIMSLLTSLVLDILSKKPKTIFKTLIIDEAWSIMATKTGRDMIANVALLGRSLNMAAILLTQSPTHIEVEDGPDLDTTISSRFAFRNDNDRDNLISVNAMKLPQNEGWESLLPKLSTGQCLMQDCTGGLSFISVLAQDGWGEVFNTNPADELKRLKNSSSN